MTLRYTIPDSAMSLSYAFTCCMRSILGFACLVLLNPLFAKSDQVPAEYRELHAIVEMEQTLMKRMQADLPGNKLDKEIQLRLNEIDEAYRSYLDTYPRSTFGQILYGKFLRKADRSEAAYAIFLDVQEDNPDIAVVNQHLALFASEIGDFKDAFRYFERAIELEPNEALYHYQFGEFLHSFRQALMVEQVLPLSELENRMAQSFRRAHELAPENRDFHARWAESFFDVFNPDWESVLPIWDELLRTSNNQFERDVLRLQKARVLLKLQRYFEASQLIEPIADPALQDSKRELLDTIP
ncbi:MAG: hypothetical protein ABQ298_12565 [Puniceicoccaceae bacterium]